MPETSARVPPATRMTTAAMAVVTMAAMIQTTTIRVRLRANAPAMGQKCPWVGRQDSSSRIWRSARVMGMDRDRRTSG